MKINICFFFFCFIFFNQARSAELIIKVLNIEEKVGSIHFAVYDNPEFFPENEGKKLDLKKKSLI